MEEPTLTTSIDVDGDKYQITAVFLENAVSIFIYEDIPRLGTLAISVPGTNIMQASTLYVTGSTDTYFVRMLGERFATRTSKLVLLSISLKDVTNELIMKIMQKTEQILFGEKNKKE